jgi:hypothetical protein
MVPRGGVDGGGGLSPWLRAAPQSSLDRLRAETLRGWQVYPEYARGRCPDHHGQKQATVGPMQLRELSIHLSISASLGFVDLCSGAS